jgi:4-hydroxy-3-methylbut-2-enyl diphosphate reductase
MDSVVRGGARSSSNRGPSQLCNGSGKLKTQPQRQHRPRAQGGRRLSVRASGATSKEEVVVAEASQGFDARAFRRSLNQTGRYTRKPSNDPDSLSLMEDHGVGYSTTGLIAQMREQGNEWKQGEVTVKLAEAYGFCWGVERAVQMAYEARKAYPNQRLHITNEIIHNPGVNDRLKEMGVEFIEQSDGGDKDFSGVERGDVVILPAFGASVQEMRLLNEREVQIVDTTCPWVSKVWNAVDNQARKGHTSIIHGKWAHEETIATASFAGTYVVVKDLKEAQYVCDYILHGGDRAEFLNKFKNAMSDGFDPDKDLDRVGMANQTTMLKGETEAIGKLLEKTMMSKYGPAELNQHFMVMDTICDATQERQDAVYSLTGQQDNNEAKLDMMVVVGGFNSSNTSHLQEIGEMKGIPSFWVDSAARIDVESNTITHKLAHGELVETSNWLPQGPLVVGVTSGASTPDKAVEDVLERVFRIKDPNFTGIAPKQTTVKKTIHEEE